MISPPRPKGPPLNALRAFEASARLGGFSAASEELSVTPGAVAQYIKALEAWAGEKLFERRSQGVVLTALGQNVLGDFSAAFDQLGDAVQALRTQTASKHIRIATLPSIAQLWLSPRLPALRLAVPDVTFSITAMENAPNLRREPYDLSIFMQDLPTRAQKHDRAPIHLGADVIFPVCAPEVAARLHRLEDMSGETFLHDVSWSRDWDLWMASADMPGDIIETSGPVYSLYSLAVEEA
ncbi:MAG: LysR family transcriptional regulator, partial [Rhodobacteraceae bacterium]|nr:LysR family transcriptional regulator [Paracoccaceae bacterium]